MSDADNASAPFLSESLPNCYINECGLFARNIMQAAGEAAAVKDADRAAQHRVGQVPQLTKGASLARWLALDGLIMSMKRPYLQADVK